MIRRIGTGGYGEVWVARNVIGAYRAIKVVYRSTFESDRPYEREFAGIERFEPLSRSHEGFVDVLQVGRNDGAGYFYYVMELADDAAAESKPRTSLPDRSLRSAKEVFTEVTTIKDDGFDPATKPLSQQFNPDRYSPKTLKSALSGRRSLPLEECLQIGLSLAAALEHLHREGLIHRDIKPSNIIFVNGVPKLADIGLVAERGEARSFVGTEGFIPPEGPGAPQADLYSLGKVLYEISTGKDRQDFPELPSDWKESAQRSGFAEFNEIILKACAGDVTQRYQSAREMHVELALLQSGHSVKQKRIVESRRAIARRVALPVCLLSLVVLGVIAWGPKLRRLVAPHHTPSPSASAISEKKTIAVLPFVNESSDKADEYLGDELAEEFANALTKVGQFRVMPRNTAFAMKKAKDLREVASKLQVQTLLDGSVRKIGGKIRLNVQLISAAGSETIWSEIYDRPMNELFGVQDDVVQQVANALNIRLSAAVLERIARKSSRNLEAYNLYLVGRYHLNKRSEEGFQKAIEYFTQAITKDPNYAHAYAGLADCYNLSVDHGLLTMQEAFPKALAYIEKALAIDESLADAHASFGEVKAFNWDWDGAEKEFQRTLDLNPSHAIAHHWYALLLSARGKTEQALALEKRGEALDPLSLPIVTGVALMLAQLGRFDEALQQHRKAQEIDANYLWTPYYIGWVQVRQGNYDEAVKQFRRTITLAGESSVTLSALGYALAAAGHRAEAEQQLERLRQLADKGKPVSSWSLALIQAGLGDREQTLNLLRSASEAREQEVFYIRVEPGFQPYRSDPRFVELVRRIGLGD